MIVLCINDEWDIIASPYNSVKWTPKKGEPYEVINTLQICDRVFFKLREDPFPEMNCWFLREHFVEVDININEVEEVLKRSLHYENQ